MADKVVVPVIAGLAAGIALLIIFAIVFAPYSSRLSTSDVTRDNSYGIDARIVYARAFSGILCPSPPCDTSGFVLKVVSRHDVMVLGYETCDVSSTCIYSDGTQATHVFSTSKEVGNSIQDVDGITFYLGKKSNWNVGDTVSVKVHTAPPVKKLENDITSWYADPNKAAVWIDAGQSKILEVDIM